MEHTKADKFTLKNSSCDLFTDYTNWTEGGPTYSLRFCESETGYELIVKGLSIQTLAKLCQSEPIVEALSQKNKKAAEIVHLKPPTNQKD